MTVTIIATNAWEAEAAAKTVFLLGSAEGLAWLETHPSLAGLLIRENNQLIYSQHIEEYLRR